MLLFLAIICYLLSFVLGLMIYWANMMSDAPTTQMSFLPFWIGIGISTVIGMGWLFG